MPPRGIDDEARQRIDGYGTRETNRNILRATITDYFEGATVTPEDLEHFLEVGLMAGTTALRKTQEALCVSPAIPRDQLAAVKAPTLIVMGTHDPFGTFDHAVALSDAIPKSRIFVMSRCGHSPMWEKPIEFVKALTEFLGENGLK
jgi:pimeloyl-ACP methyl ester carboxylesterase